ncbi:MAG: hypothetical protein IKD69_08050, partial [Solobacterium sp.]|nr:hypothetical protein [Solobacterium sp.]
MPRKKKEVVEEVETVEEKKPVKRTRKTKAAEAPVEETAAAETAEKKPVKRTRKAKAAETAEPAAEEKKPVKRTRKPKAAAEEVKAEEPAAEEKKPAKRTKKAKAEEPAVQKMTVQDYIDKINWKKGEAHGMDWLYIEISGADLQTEFEADIDNMEVINQAIKATMLEGDTFMDETEGASLTVRYYCDNPS